MNDDEKRLYDEKKAAEEKRLAKEEADRRDAALRQAHADQVRGLPTAPRTL